MTEQNGVHWFWWVFWLIVFWPAVFLVWMEHNNRKRHSQKQTEVEND